MLHVFQSDLCDHDNSTSQTDRRHAVAMPRSVIRHSAAKIDRSCKR